MRKAQSEAGLEASARARRAKAPPGVFTEIEPEYVLRGANLSGKAAEDAIRLSKEKYASALIVIGETAITTAFRIEQAEGIKGGRRG